MEITNVIFREVFVKGGVGGAGIRDFCRLMLARVAQLPHNSSMPSSDHSAQTASLARCEPGQQLQCDGRH